MMIITCVHSYIFIKNKIVRIFIFIQFTDREESKLCPHFKGGRGHLDLPVSILLGWVLGTENNMLQ